MGQELNFSLLTEFNASFQILHGQVLAQAFFTFHYSSVYSRNLKKLILGVQFVLNGTELGILLKTMEFGVYGMGLWNDVLFHYSS